MAGPERLDRFMARANAAYYATRDPFRDFTTAPEIAQVFGELLGAWAAVTWQLMGRPDPVLLVEAGPGRGTLMADALRLIGRVAPDFNRALQVHLIETSPRLRAIQAAKGIPATWHGALADVPRGPAIVLANEFLDALPIRQFVRRQAGWCERHVENGQFVDFPVDGFAFPYPEGSVLEFGEAGEAWTSELALRLVRDGGAALLLDYGRSESGPGDTLQALRDGRPADPLADPGSADLTSHIDFEALRNIAMRTGAQAFGPLAQGAFLDSLGLAQRTSRLANANPARAADLHQSASRLASPQRMGDLFKVLCLTAGGLIPPGFEQPVSTHAGTSVKEGQ